MGGHLRRTGWTEAMACAAVVAIGAQVAGTKGAEGERRACTVGTLRGSYVFSASGFNIVSGVQQPKAIVEVIAFNGDGSLDVPAATVSLNGVIIPRPPVVAERFTGFDEMGRFHLGLDSRSDTAENAPARTGNPVVGKELLMVAQGRTLELLRLAGIVGIITATAMSLSDISLL